MNLVTYPGIHVPTIDSTLFSGNPHSANLHSLSYEHSFYMLCKEITDKPVGWDPLENLEKLIEIIDRNFCSIGLNKDGNYTENHINSRTELLANYTPGSTISFNTTIGLTQLDANVPFYVLVLHIIANITAVYTALHHNNIIESVDTLYEDFSIDSLLITPSATATNVASIQVMFEGIRSYNKDFGKYMVSASSKVDEIMFKLANQKLTSAR